MKYCHYLFVALGITSAAILASCQDEDFGYTSDQIAYRTNFEKMYGSVKDIPTWDFSSYNLRHMGLEGGPSYAPVTRAGGTRAGGNDGAKPTDKSLLLSSNSLSGISSDGMDGEWYKVEDPTLSWLNTKLPEGHYNVNLGNPFVLGVPESDFAIIPIYQGHAGMNWDLHLVADGKDYTIWSKSEGIRYEEDYDETGAEYHYGSGALHDWQGEDPNKYATKVWLGDAFPDALRSGASHIKLKIVIPEGATLTGKFTTSGANPTVWDFDGMGKGQTHSSNTYIFGLDTWPNFNDLNFVTGAGTNGCVLDGYNDARVRFYAIFEGKGSVMKELGTDVSNLTGHTVDRKNVQAKPIMIDHTKITKDFFLYLKIKSGDPSKSENYYANVGACQRSDEGMMVALPCTKPSNINNGYEYMIIGCEDADKNSDWDVNDIVFLLVGQGKLPRVKEIISKRYMIEDLGSTYDFDFNDIVVDVTQTTVKKYDGAIDTSVGKNGVIQTANLVHLCGTIPFKIQIGTSTLGGADKVFQGCNEGAGEGEDGCDPLTHNSASVYSDGINYEIEGWSPDDNNIVVTTYPNQAGWTDQGKTGFIGEHPQAEGHTFTFPETGKYPYIIACDQTVDWMPELKTIPSSWFVTNPVYHGSGSNDNGGNDNGDSGNDDPTTINDYVLGTSISVTYQSDDSGWNNYVKIGSNLSGVQAGDKIIATISNVQSGAKLLFKKTLSSGWGDISSVDPLATTATEVTLEVTAENIDDIKSGVAIQGLGFTLTEIQLVRELNFGENGVLSGYGETSNKPLINVALSKGDKIKIEYTVTSSSGTIQVFERTGEDWSWSYQKDFNNLTSSGSITCTMVSDDVIHGIAIQGENITITKVSKIN